MGSSLSLQLVLLLNFVFSCQILENNNKRTWVVMFLFLWLKLICCVPLVHLHNMVVHVNWSLQLHFERTIFLYSCKYLHSIRHHLQTKLRGNVYAVSARLKLEWPFPEKVKHIYAGQFGSVPFCLINVSDHKLENLKNRVCSS